MHWITSIRGLVDSAWLVFLLLSLRYFWIKYQLLHAAEQWLKVRGKITSLQWGQEGGNLWPTLRYSYEVYERNFEGEYLFLETALNSPNSKYARTVAYKAAMAFQEQSEIEVYYNPNNPLQAALDVRIPNKLIFIIAAVTGLIAFHLTSIAYYLVVG